MDNDQKEKEEINKMVAYVDSWYRRTRTQETDIYLQVLITMGEDKTRSLFPIRDGLNR